MVLNQLYLSTWYGIDINPTNTEASQVKDYYILYGIFHVHENHGFEALKYLYI